MTRSHPAHAVFTLPAGVSAASVEVARVLRHFSLGHELRELRRDLRDGRFRATGRAVEDPRGRPAAAVT